MEASGLLAFQQVQRMLAGIDLSAIWSILLSMLKDVALYYGGSVVVGTGIGAAVGALGFGVGAIPGAAAGAAAGSEFGAWLLGVLGLASLLIYMGDAIPEAFNDYKEGFRLAWGSDRNQSHGRQLPTFGEQQTVHQAAHRFASGHVIVVVALLAAIVAYLSARQGSEGRRRCAAEAGQVFVATGAESLGVDRKESDRTHQESCNSAMVEPAARAGRQQAGGSAGAQAACKRKAEEQAADQWTGTDSKAQTAASKVSSMEALNKATALDFT